MYSHIFGMDIAPRNDIYQSDSSEMIYGVIASEAWQSTLKYFDDFRLLFLV